jgi:DNA integrity scanning protein DisA with diadenylate cyclase activity
MLEISSTQRQGSLKLDQRTSPKKFGSVPIPEIQEEKITVLKTTTQNNRWINHITPILTVAELQEFIFLWEVVTTVERVEDFEDEITWKGTCLAETNLSMQTMETSI